MLPVPEFQTRAGIADKYGSCGRHSVRIRFPSYVGRKRLLSVARLNDSADERNGTRLRTKAEHRRPRLVHERHQQGAAQDIPRNRPVQIHVGRGDIAACPVDELHRTISVRITVFYPRQVSVRPDERTAEVRAVRRKRTSAETSETLPGRMPSQ